MGCGADTEANELLISLTSGDDFVIPDIDLSGPEYQIPGDGTGPAYEPIEPLTEAKLTSRVVGGSGMFDGLMVTFSAHLRAEFEKGRITGSDYTKAYIALTESALSGAVSYLLGKDQAFWQAQLAQAQAVTAKVQLATAKVQMSAIQIEAMNSKAAYALTKLKLSTESVTSCTAQYNLSNVLPQQLAKITSENEGQLLSNQTDKYNLETILPAQYATIVLQQAGLGITNDTATYNLATTLPLQTQLLTKQNDGQGITNNTAQFQLSDLLPQQLKNLKAQETLVREQMEVQRGQTHDMRTDNIPVAGVLGKQKLLYSQQITSYQRDAEVKTAKLFTDAWITQKTMDEGLLPPTGFTNASLDTILAKLKLNNELN